VLMTSIGYADEKVVFASDVQGPMHVSTLNWILAEKPQLVIVGGPPTYLAGFKVPDKCIELGMQNLKSLVENVPTTVLGHHILRDERWRSYVQPVFDAATENGNKVLTAAEYLGKENSFLEFRRRQLFEMEPPSSEFEKWIKMPMQRRKLEKPPI
jgi:predicted metallo-beta-lactamase superfamily hydrolase